MQGGLPRRATRRLSGAGLALLAGSAAVAFSVPTPAIVPASADAATKPYPGQAPCNKSLQRCINNSKRGTKIRIRTDGPIAEELDIEKSVTLFAAAQADPVIGGDDEERNLGVETGARALKATLRGIEFRNVEIDIDFDTASGHRFVLADSVIDNPLGSTASRGVEVDAEVPATVAIRNNEIATTGYTFDVRVEPATGAAAEAAIVNNRITTSDEPAGVNPNLSSAGIALSMGGAGRGEVDVYSNLVHGVAGCNCGNPAAIGIRGAPADGTVNLVGNTVDDAQYSAYALWVINDNPGSLTVNAFNNIFSNASDAVVRLPAADPNIAIAHDYNDVYDPGDPPSYGGYPAGPHSDAQDPLYVDAAAGDYHLQPASPQKQQGLVCPPGGQSAADLAGNDRVERVPGQGAFVTPGAFGFATAPPSGTLFLGTDQSDNFTGGAGGDVFCGYGADDEVAGGKGDDVAFAGAGADDVRGGENDDYLYGEAGQDMIVGGTGSDYLSGGDDFDTLDSQDGVEGNDILDGGGGVDSCNLDNLDIFMSC
jgi:hypothetical protein